MNSVLTQKNLEFKIEMTSNEFHDFVEACDKLAVLSPENKNNFSAATVVQNVKNSMLLALNQ